MGDYKDKHGKSRVHDLLKNIGQALPGLVPDIIDVVTSGNPIGAILGKLKDKLSSKQTGQTGGNFLKQLNEISTMEMEAFKMELQDKSGARYICQSTGHEQADKIADNIMKRNLQYIAILVLVNIAVMVFSEKLGLNTALVVAIGNIVGMVLQSLINERNQVVSFYMGSSIGSKIKDKMKSL